MTAIQMQQKLAQLPAEVSVVALDFTDPAARQIFVIDGRRVWMTRGALDARLTSLSIDGFVGSLRFGAFEET